MRFIKSLNQKLQAYRIFRLRHRYIFTRQNKLRLRYVCGTALVVGVSMTSLLSYTSSSVAYAPVNALEVAEVIEPRSSIAVLDKRAEDEIATAEAVTQPLMVEVETYEEAANVHDDLNEEEEVSALRVEGQPVYGPVYSVGPREEILEIKTGDTIAGALQNMGLSGAEAYRAVKAMSKHYDPRMIKPGQAISVHVQNGDSGLELVGLNMQLDAIREVSIDRDAQGRFVAILNQKDVILQVKAAQASIETSLYGSAAQAGIPASVVAEMIRIYSYQVDFQRDIRQGDKVEILYEVYETEDGRFARYGDVLFANLAVGGKDLPVYRYSDKNGDTDYYRENGLSLKRTLMKTPVDGARMSSGFGMRRHPVLGYNKMHKGVDFAAPRGTPIYAAGKGVVERAGRNGGYGNYIRIKHNGSLKTAYAHLHKFAKGIKSGVRVKQGQIIGYVGSTGRSTGPHLHFEVLKNGKQVNPKSIKSSAGEKLAGAKLKAFKGQISEIKQQYATLAQKLKFAENQVSQ